MTSLLLSCLFLTFFGMDFRTVEGKPSSDFRPTATSPHGRIHKVHTDCQAAYDDGWQQSGLYTISPHGTKRIDVLCEQTLDGGWTVFQKRVDGNQDFYLNWTDYQIGFGDPFGEFWLGLDNLHYMTSRNDHMLKVDLQDGGNSASAEYSSFMVDGEDTNYVLHVRGFSDSNDTNGAGDSLTQHDLRPFTTRDNDNDGNDELNCAQDRLGAWWYHHCYHSNLNGMYGLDEVQGVCWSSWTGWHHGLSATKMMIKKK